MVKITGFRFRQTGTAGLYLSLPPWEIQGKPVMYSSSSVKLNLKQKLLF